MAMDKKSTSGEDVRFKALSDALKMKAAQSGKKATPDKIQDETRAPNPFIPSNPKEAIAKFGAAKMRLRKGK